MMLKPVVQEEVDRVRQRCLEAIDERARTAVATYYDEGPGSNYAAATFDTLGVNDPNSFGPDDLLAVHLLGMTFTPSAVRAILDGGETAQRLNGLLGLVDKRVRLWDAEAIDSLENADELWSLLNGLRGVGPVTAGKLLARKRPRLIPIYDDKVQTYFGPLQGSFWLTLAEALRDPDARNRIEAARLPSMSDEMPTTIRILDVVVWMRQMKYGPYAGITTG